MTTGVSRHATSCSRQWHCCSTAAYQLARRCITRGTFHNDIAAAGAVLWHSRVPANLLGTCEWFTGVVPTRTSVLATVTCAVKRFCCRSACWHAELEHSVPSDWASCDYSYYHHHLATPHHIQFALYTSPLVAACWAAPWSCSPFAAATLPFGVQSAESGLLDSRSNGDRPYSVAACQLLCQSLLNFHNSIIECDDKSNLSTLVPVSAVKIGLSIHLCVSFTFVYCIKMAETVINQMVAQGLLFSDTAWVSLSWVPEYMWSMQFLTKFLQCLGNDTR